MYAAYLNIKTLCVSQVIQMDSGSNPGNPQIIIGPNGLQVAAPPAGQGALTQQQQVG